MNSVASIYKLGRLRDAFVTRVVNTGIYTG